MKKALIYILALIIFTVNIYAGDGWFLLTPSIDSSGEVVDYKNYDDVKKIKMEFKIVEIINKIL